MMHLVVMLEEKSAGALLRGLLPRLAPGLQVTPIVHEGKKDLEKSLPIKLRAWQDKNVHFIVLRDKDGDDCRVLKKRLLNICRKAGRPNSIVRIAVHCLEAWLLGDMPAVAAAYNKPGLGACPT